MSFLKQVPQIIKTNNPALNHRTGNQYPTKLTTFSMIGKAANTHSVQQIFNAGDCFSVVIKSHILHSSEINGNSE